MSILLEALKQKNSQDQHAKKTQAEPAQSMVTEAEKASVAAEDIAAEISKNALDQPGDWIQMPPENVDSLQDVVDALAIQKPAEIDSPWQMKRTSDQPNQPTTATVTPPSEPPLMDLQLSLTPIKPVSQTVSEPINQPEEDKSVTPSVEVAAGDIVGSDASETQPFNLALSLPIQGTPQVEKAHEKSAIDSSNDRAELTMSEATVSPELSNPLSYAAVESISPALQPKKNIVTKIDLDDDAPIMQSSSAQEVEHAAPSDAPAAHGQATIALDSTESASSTAKEVSHKQTVDESASAEQTSPEAAKNFLKFARRRTDKIEPINIINTEPVVAQPNNVNNKLQNKHIYARRSLLFVVIGVMGVGALALSVLSAWEQQQAEFEQQIARYKNISLADLPVQPLVTESTSSVASTDDVFTEAEAELRHFDKSALLMAEESAEVSRPMLTELAEPIATEKPSAAVETPSKAIQSEPKSVANNVAYSSADDLGVLDTTSKQRPVNQDIQLTKTQETDRLLHSAYQAWNRGSFAEAERAYRQVLEKQPVQKDALLGMFAIAQVTQKDPEITAAYASKLQAAYPRDKDVSIAIQSFYDTDASDRLSESELKNMLQAEESAQARYQLGLLYAEQQRWPEAQSAFFDAVSQAPQEVDYRYNLAISYDYLGKSKLALEQYQQVISLAKRKNISMNLADVEQRAIYLQSVVYGYDD